MAAGLCLAVAAIPFAHAADTAVTGFVVDSEIESGIGDGAVHQHLPATMTGVVRERGVDLQVDGWRFLIDTGFWPLQPGTYTGALSDLHIRSGSETCGAQDYTLTILEPPTRDGDVVTSFAADFSVGHCNGADGGLYGSIRLASAQSIRLVHVTSALAFPDTVVGATATGRTVEFRNIGNVDAAIGPFTIVGANAADFPFLDTCGTGSLDPGQDCSIVVGFEPSSTTQRVAQGRLPTDTHAGLRTVDLSGYGLSPVTQSPSSLVVDSLPSHFGGGDHYYDPTTMTAAGNAARITFLSPGWRVRFEAPNDSVLAPGTYPEFGTSSTDEIAGMQITALGSTCGTPVEGSFTILEGPLIDSDGTILQFAADFDYRCVGRPDDAIRGWLRFHSELPVPLVEAVTYAIDVSTGSTAQIGESITLTPEVTGTDFLRHRRCSMTIEGTNVTAPLYMSVAADDCAPWTVVLPPAPTGTYVVHGWLSYSETTISQPIILVEDVLEIVPGGTPEPFATNYPVFSWNIADLVSDPTPAYGSAWTVAGIASVDGCEQSIEAGFEGALVRQYARCDPWTLAIPAPAPPDGETWQLQGSHLLLTAWEGRSVWLEEDVTHPRSGARRGQTHTTSLGDLSGTSKTPHTSDLPAVFTGTAREQFFYVDDPAVHLFTPVVLGFDSGTCRFLTTSIVVRSITAGSCGSVAIPPPESPSGGQQGVGVEILDDQDRLVASAGTTVAYGSHMEPLSLAITAVSAATPKLEIAASTAAGLPASYTITVRPATGGAPVARTFTGDLERSLDKSGDAVSVTATGLPAGTYDVAASFRDITGEAVSSTQRVTIAPPPPSDTVKPSVPGAPVHRIAGAVTTGFPIRLTWTPGADAGSGVAGYVLQRSIDGGPFATVAQPVSPTIDVQLSSSSRTYRFRVATKDHAGNTSPFATGILFRTISTSESGAAVRYTGKWSSIASSTYLGGKARTATARTASATLTFTGNRIAWLSQRGPTSGLARIYIDGKFHANIDLHAAHVAVKQVVFQKSWTPVSTHVVKIVVLGTTGHPKATIDHFYTVR